jgi:uncharacterized protein YraI
VLVFALLGVIVALPTAQPAQAQNPPWIGQYYNNTTLSDPVVATQTDPNIAFNWGLGSPVAGVGVDNFSVRWATDVALTPGTYRFFALADDNIRITFNFNQTVIDTFASGQIGQLLSADVVVPSSGTYHIQVDYREVSGDAYAYVSYQNASTNPTSPNFANPTPGPTFNTGTWTAQYFANPTLSGDPSAILSEPSPSHNWGTGSPAPGVPSDNWSARFTSVQNLPAGTYTATINVDDGARLYVNGVLFINQFGGATGQTFTASFPLAAGPNTFQIDYVENTGPAFLDYRLSFGSGAAATATPGAPAGSYSTATVTAYRLNVRTQPSPTAQVITRINRNETYPVTGRSADGRWYQIFVANQLGWVNGSYVNVPNGGSVPIVATASSAATSTPLPNSTGIIVTATPYTVNIRSGPGTEYSRLGQMPAGSTAAVIGRNSSSTWWQVNYNGIVGWVAAEYARIQTGANVNSIPITG